MWNQFFLENAHFAISLFVSLVFFAMFWLHFDAWVGNKTKKESFKIAGFLLLSLSFLIYSTFVETALLTSVVNINLQVILIALTRIPGYALLITGLLMDPLQKKPDPKKVKNSMLSFGFPSFLAGFSLFYPILAAVSGFLYLRKATVGLENHLKPVALALFILSIFEFLSLFSGFRDTPNIGLYNLVAPFGAIWILEHIVLLLVGLALGRWVFGYLLKRLQTQLFMFLVSAIVLIFLFTTVAFTSLLLKNLEDQTLSRLETDAKVLSFAIDSKKGENLSDAQVLAQNPEVQTAVSEKTRSNLSRIVQDFLLTKNQSTLVIVDDGGQVLARGEDKERVGDSLSDDVLIKRALLGDLVSSVVTKDGVLAPEISIRSAASIKKDGKVIGAVMTGTTVDNAFVDGVKNATGLEANLYADNILSATTLLSPDGKARAVGIKEEDKNVKNRVLVKGQTFVGGLSILNVPYFVAYLPLKDIDNVPVGMLSAGKSQSGVLEAAGRSIELTFIVAVVLLVLSIFPALLIAKYIAKQLE